MDKDLEKELEWQTRPLVVTPLILRRGAFQLLFRSPNQQGAMKGENPPFIKKPILSRMISSNTYRPSKKKRHRPTIDAVLLDRYCRTILPAIQNTRQKPNYEEIRSLLKVHFPGHSSNHYQQYSFPIGSNYERSFSLRRAAIDRNRAIAKNEEFKSCKEVLIAIGNAVVYDHHHVVIQAHQSAHLLFVTTITASYWRIRAVEDLREWTLPVTVDLGFWDYGRACAIEFVLPRNRIVGMVLGLLDEEWREKFKSESTDAKLSLVRCVVQDAEALFGTVTVVDATKALNAAVKTIDSLDNAPAVIENMAAPAEGNPTPETQEVNNPKFQSPVSSNLEKAPALPLESNLGSSIQTAAPAFFPSSTTPASQPSVDSLVTTTSFPVLSRKYLEVIEKALGPFCPEVVVRGFNVDLKKHDIQTLKPGQWLNDEVSTFFVLQCLL
ncbi:hypothetical protein BDR26DRAFT_907100 [Obelidium mucronatum]|nr:hypothetical protein BDR26DRAFT_907100 [Obelidium mucronatum]